MAAQLRPDQFLDPVWRINNLYSCISKSGKVVPFRLWDEQREFLTNIHTRNDILKCRQRGFCLDPATRVLTADLRWVQIQALSVGDEIVAVDEYPLNSGKGQQRRMRTAQVQGVVEVHRKAYRITFDDSRSVVCTGQHPWLSDTAGGNKADWRKIEGDGKKRLKVGSSVRWVTKPWADGDLEDGWFGGMLDGEGSFAKRAHGAHVNVCQRRGPVWDRLNSYAESRGYHATIEADESKRESKLGSQPIPKLVFGRMDEMFRLIGQTRPTRFIQNRFWEGRELPGKKTGIGWARITSIEEVGEQTLIDLQTSTGTYIAEGFVSHNTTLMCIVQLDDCIFTPTTRAAVIAHRLDDAKVIFRDKVKFPYDALDDGLKASVPAIQDSADTMTFANNSSFRVSTSVRSGTLQWLHVSEYGKICAQFPDKAREIKTGSFPAAEAGVITVESTAEGESGDFFDITAEAQRLLNVGARLTRKDFKFFFYPWWRAKEYVLDRTNVPVSPEDDAYFERIGHEIAAVPSLADHFDGFTQAQKNWWVTEQAHLGSDMKREYPSTPKEAFEQAIEGAIFAEDIAIAHKHKRIGNFPFDKTRPVNTFWDLGHSDETAIWLEQDVGSQPTMIGYYENSGEGIEHYLRWLKAWADERQAVFGKHYLPHDGDRKSIWTPEGSMVVMSRLGFRPNIVNRHPDKWEAVKIGRRKFGTVAFDEAGTKEGMQRLKAYRKEWDDRRSVWKDHPHHGPESNGADAFLTFAQSGHSVTAEVTHDNDRHKSRYYEREEADGSWLTY